VRDTLTRDDIDTLIAAQPSLRDQVALILLAYLGLRKDELRRLRLSDVDLEARTLTVHGKGGHVDTLPIGFEHVYNALALYMRDGSADEYLLYPKDYRGRPDGSCERTPLV
jgi:integrase